MQSLFNFDLMSRYHSHLNTAVSIIKEYDGKEPLANYLKKFFGANKKYGSKDRKNIAHLCYCYFRLGKTLADFPVEEKIIAGLFLCSTESNELLQNLKPEWDEKVLLSNDEKCSMFNVQFSMLNLFAFPDELSDGIDAGAFAKSFLVQPDLFLRIRPGYAKTVLDKLNTSGLKFEIIGEDCIAVSNSSKLENILAINKEIVIQDYSSQRVGEFIQLSTANCQLPTKVWDCCAASGGKSILAKDILGGIELTVSDIRESILFNLKKRFAEAGIKNYQSFIADVSTTNGQRPTANQDLIITDVPCTGSGTWSRMPEQLYFFNHQTIEQFSQLQKKIVSNVIDNLNPGGHLLYITCSVFKKENEEVVEFIQQKFNITLIKEEVLTGYHKKADTMFAALLQKPVTV